MSMVQVVGWEDENGTIHRDTPYPFTFVGAVGQSYFFGRELRLCEDGILRAWDPTG